MSDARANPKETQLKRAYASWLAWLLFLTPAILGAWADLQLKAWSFPDGIPPEALANRDLPIPVGRFAIPQPVIPGFLRLRTVVNQGAVFGWLQGHVPLFLAFSLIALAIILWVFLTSGSRQWIVHWALGLITAGAIGNVYDRAMFAGVRDMLQFYVSWYPYIFNLADALLCIAVPLLMLAWMIGPTSPKKTDISPSPT